MNGVDENVSIVNEMCGTLIGKRVLVFNDSDAKRLFSIGFYGKPLGMSKASPETVKAPLELSLVEAVYLVEKGVLCVRDHSGKVVGFNALYEYSRKSLSRFDELYAVYRDLREKGYIVRTGLKYGAEFVIYEKGPGIEHAPYVVHVLRQRDVLDPLEIVKAGRLSHSVRKKFVIASVSENGRDVEYIVISWSKI